MLPLASKPWEVVKLFDWPPQLMFIKDSPIIALSISVGLCNYPIRRMLRLLVLLTMQAMLRHDGQACAAASQWENSCEQALQQQASSNRPAQRRAQTSGCEHVDFAKYGLPSWNMMTAEQVLSIVVDFVIDVLDNMYSPHIWALPDCPCMHHAACTEQQAVTSCSLQLKMLLSQLHQYVDLHNLTITTR